MSSPFTLELLQDKIGKEYVEANPVTEQPRIIQGLNGVWEKLEEHGGVSQVAKVFGLSEAGVWGWVDDHCIPDLYLRYLIDPGERVSDVQLSSVGYEDPVSGRCWPENWIKEPSDVAIVVCT
ncbi:MAG: hypothetical protein Q8M93_02455 [Polaromonas sp.]|uniref:hypothetical protein n=2 Tax=Polaromonas sp. TaxID=1869339 RepID=UPI00273021BE|nr:hypothetical protein [Polaromonas sp.]MDP2448610.1 hypothetical protein [Polaromonas sp.]MDP3245809.1 hypothetical protein [Polaromonas sp.]